jgi:hypothetical protein
MAENNKPKSKLRQQWDEIRDLSKYVRPEDKDRVAKIMREPTAKDKMLSEAADRHENTAREMGPIPFHGKWMKRFHNEKAADYRRVVMLDRDLERQQYAQELYKRRAEARRKANKEDPRHD